MTVWTTTKEEWSDPFEDIEFTPELKQQIRETFKNYEPDHERLKAFDTKVHWESLMQIVD
jgi:hypothetical protein